MSRPQPESDVLRPERSNRIAAAGLALGINAALAAFIPEVGVILALLPGVLAVTFGWIGLLRATRPGGLRLQVSLAAIAFGLSPIPIGLLVLVSQQN